MSALDAQKEQRALLWHFYTNSVLVGLLLTHRASTLEAKVEKHKVQGQPEQMRQPAHLDWAMVAAHHLRDTLLTLHVSLSHSQGHFRFPRTLSSHIGPHVRALRWRCLGPPKASC